VRDGIFVSTICSKRHRLPVLVVLVIEDKLNKLKHFDCIFIDDVMGYL